MAAGIGKYGILLIFSLAALLFIGGCNEQTLESSWNESELSNEPLDSTWVHSSVYFLEDQYMSIGLGNDNNTLSIMLKSMDQDTYTKIMRAGFTIWLDTSGKKNKTFGIHYPLGFLGRMEPRGERPSREDRSDFQRNFMTMPDTMEIIVQDKRIKLPINNDRGVEVATSSDRGLIVYRLLVPLKALTDSSFSLNAVSGETIGFGFETGKFERPEKGEFRRRGESPGDEPGGEPGGEPGNGPGGGYGGRGGMGGAGRGMPQGERGGGMNFDPIKYWAKLILAGEPGK